MKGEMKVLSHTSERNTVFEKGKPIALGCPVSQLLSLSINLDNARDQVFHITLYQVFRSLGVNKILSSYRLSAREKRQM